MTPTNAQLRACYLLATTMMVAYAGVFTLLAEIRSAYGFSETAIGLIAGAAFAAGFVSQLVLSPLADRGQGRWLLRLGLLMSVAGLLWMLVASSLWEWLAARAVLGFGSGAVRPALRRYVVVLDPAQAGRKLGQLAAWEVGGFLLGPVLASLLFSLGGLALPFAVTAGLFVLLGPFIWFVNIPGAAQPMKRALATLVRRPAMQAALGLGVGFYCAIGVFDAVWALYMADLGASPVHIGITMSLFTLPMIIIAPLAGGFAERRHVLNLATLTLFVAMLCLSTYGLFTSIWWICLPLILHAVVDAVSMPAMQLAVARASGESALAAGQGLYGASGMVVGAVASVGGGALYEYGGPNGLWGGTAAVMGVCLLIAWLRGRALPEFAGPIR